MVFNSLIKQLIFEVENSIKRVHDYRKGNFYVLNKRSDKMEYSINVNHKK